MAEFSPRHKFSDWPNAEVPAVTAGVYAVWEGETLIYCGMSGRMETTINVGDLAGILMIAVQALEKRTADLKRKRRRLRRWRRG